MLRQSNKYRKKFKYCLAEYLNINQESIHFFWKGRVALYAILKGLGVKNGDKVILPAFTCIAAINPIIYLGAEPVYVDIDPRTYTIDYKKIEKKIDSQVRAILAQNTYGLAPDLDEILKLKDKYDIAVIEDCAHGFGGYYKGKLNGTVADASFYSCQWNKPFSTGLGGIAITNMPALMNNLKHYEETFRTPTLKDMFFLKVLISIREKIPTSGYWVSIKTYRWLSKHNIVLGSSQKEELEGVTKPANFEKGYSEFQAKIGLRELKKFPAALEKRLKTANSYKDILNGLKKSTPYEPDYAIHTFLKFPILVKNKEKFFSLAERAGIEIGDWFLSPIHPSLKDFERWHYNWGANPIGEKISRHVVNLPTHKKTKVSSICEIENFLKQNEGMIF